MKVLLVALLLNSAACQLEPAGKATGSVHDLPSTGVVRGKVPGKGQATIYCHEGSGWAQLHKAFHVIDANVTSTGGSWIKVHQATSNNLYDMADDWVKHKLGMGEAQPEVVNKLRGKDKRFHLMPTLDFLKECPAVWSSERDVCRARLSPFGKTCISVNSDKPDFEVHLSEGLDINLIFMLAVGLLLLVWAGEVSQSKIAQYITGASLGVTSGIALLFLYLFRRSYQGNMKPVAIGTFAGYAAALYAFLKYYFVRVVANYWEVLVVYSILSAALGLFITSQIRSHDSWKMAARSFGRWFLRLVGVAAVYNSTFSPLAQGVFVATAVLGAVVLQLMAFIDKTRRDETAARSRSKQKPA